MDKDSVVRKFRTTADDGKTYNVTYYNLDMIISLGYRIKSVIATRFRQWATKRLKEYMIKGFTIDDERLKVHTAYIAEVKRDLDLSFPLLSNIKLNMSKADYKAAYSY